MSWLLGGIVATLVAIASALGWRIGHRKGVRRTYETAQQIRYATEIRRVADLEAELAKIDDLLRQTKTTPPTKEEAQALIDEIDRSIGS